MNRSRSRVARRPRGPRIVRVKSTPRSHRMTRQANLLLLCACALALSACHRATVAEAPPAEPQQDLASVTVTGSRVRAEAEMAQRRAMAPPAPIPSVAYLAPPPPVYSQPANTEHYAAIDDNPVHRTSEQPVSTFSIDVDTGSYANVRRMLRYGTRPPAAAVRAEEMINYFRHGHPAPDSLEVPFRVTTELAPAPWDARRQLLMIGIKGYDVPK